MIRIITVNWKGYSDTLECLESLLAADLPPRTIIVVADNESNQELSNKTLDNLINKINGHHEKIEHDEVLIVRHKDIEIHWICIPTNTGYSRANNIGAIYSDKLHGISFEYTWLLNNDTIIDKHALTSMINRMKEDANNKICGSVLLYYDEKTTIQSTGVKYNKYNAKGLNINNNKDYLSTKPKIRALSPDFVVGASILIENKFFTRVGYLSEDYFLYFEEIDLSQKMLPNEKIVVCEESLVYHKEGASIGTNTRQQSSPTSIYHYTISSLIFTKKHFKYIFPIVVAIYTAKLILFIAQKNKDKTKGLGLALKDFFTRNRRIGKI